jgi:protein-L-isoaspartate(D-aspartate) O-methyltransferase
MLEPRVEARLLQELKRAHATRRCSRSAPGSGFMAALLAHRAQQVVTLESVPELAKHGGATTCAVRPAQRAPWSTSAPPTARAAMPPKRRIDAIVLSGSVAEVPRGLLEQLKVGGRLIAIVGEQPVMRATLFTRSGEAMLRSVEVFDTVAPRLQGFAENRPPSLLTPSDAEPCRHRTEALDPRHRAGRCCWTCANRGNTALAAMPRRA